MRGVGSMVVVRNLYGLKGEKWNDYTKVMFHLGGGRGGICPPPHPHPKSAHHPQKLIHKWTLIAIIK